MTLSPSIRCVIAAFWILSALLLFRLTSADTAFGGERGPAAAKIPLDDRGRMQVAPADRCPVCGMKVIDYPKFAAALQLRDGTTFHFCGPLCMAQAWVAPARYLNVTPDRRHRVTVVDYYTGEQTDGLAATWIAGSDVVGPMGYTLIPLARKDHLQAFQRRHGGKVVFHFSELTPDLLNEIPNGPGMRTP